MPSNTRAYAWEIKCQTLTIARAALSLAIRRTMHRDRLIGAALLGGLLMPVAAFLVGAISYDVAGGKVTNALWTPPLAVQGMFEAFCTRPFSGSFVCPYSQGQHDRLFATSFFLAYFVIGAVAAGLIAKIWLQKVQRNT